MKEAKTIKGECCLRLLESGGKPSLPEDLNGLWKQNILAAAVIDTDMLDTRQGEDGKLLWAMFRTWTFFSGVAKLNPLMSIDYFWQQKIHFRQAWLKSSIWLHKFITGYYLESKSLMFDSDMFLIPCPFTRSRPWGITVYIQLCSKPKYYAHVASAFNTKESELQKLKSCNAQKTQLNNYLNPDIFITLFPQSPFISKDNVPLLPVKKKTHNFRLSAINIAFTTCQTLLVSASTASSWQNHYWFTSSLEIYCNDINTMSAMWDPKCAEC